MQVIPVIDVRGGEAVAASRGDRAGYRRLGTPLAATAGPVTVAEALRDLFPFPTLYIADLDGIEGRGADLAMQGRVAAAWLGRELWIDDGSAGQDHAGVGRPPLLSSPTGGEEREGQRLVQQAPSPLWGGLGWGDAQRLRSIVNHVMGSESLGSLDHYNQARERAGLAAPLSLDFRGDTFLGPPDLLENADLWPDRVIVMTLARVGSGEGPDLARLAPIVARAGRRSVYAAGGVRHPDDLKALRDIGVAGALISTALHSRAITPADLDALGAERDV